MIEERRFTQFCFLFRLQQQEDNLICNAVSDVFHTTGSFLENIFRVREFEDADEIIMEKKTGPVVI